MKNKTPHHGILALLGILCAPLLAATASGATLQFSNGLHGYKSSVDVSIKRGEGVVNPELKNITFGNYTVGKTGEKKASQALIRFDDIFGEGRRIPKGAVITKATLRLAVGVNTALVSKIPVNFHRVLVPWGKDAQWKYKTWGKNGVILDDKIAVKTPDTSVVFDKARTSYKVDVTQSLQAWAKGEPNEGWVLVINGHVAGFVSSRADYQSQRPLLTVTFETP